MNKIYFLQNGNFDLKTGGYIFNKELIGGLTNNSYDVELITLRAKSSSAEILQEFILFCESIVSGSVIFIDGLIGAFLSEGILKYAEKMDIYYILHLPQMNSAEASEKNALEYSKRIISTSKYTTDLLKGLGINPEKILTLQPAPNLFEKKSIFPDKPHSLLMVGSVVERKGVLEIIKILSKINAKWHLTLVGEIDFEPEYTDRVYGLLKELNLEKRVSIKGPKSIEYLKGIYSNADLFISNSTNETYGMALWDAVYAGLPTAINSIPAHKINFKSLDVDFFDHKNTERALIYFEKIFNRAGYKKAIMKAAENSNKLMNFTWNDLSLQLIKWF